MNYNNITEEYFKRAVNNNVIWKAPGPDGMHDFWGKISMSLKES